MHQKLEQIDAILTSIRGARDVEVYRAGKSLHVVADMNRDATARMGVPVRGCRSPHSKVRTAAHWQLPCSKGNEKSAFG